MSKVERVKLGDVAILERKTADLEGCVGQPYISLEDIDSDTGEISIVERSTPRSTKFSFSEKHVLYGKLRPYLRKVSRPCFRGICSTDIIPIMPSSVLDRNFLFHYLRTNEFTELATKLAVGVNLPRLSPKQLSTFEIPLCPLPEQQRIARILDAADALRATRREALAQLDTLIQATFLDMFGDPVTNPMGWEERTLLGEVADIVSGLTKGRKLKNQTTRRVPYLAVVNVQDRHLVLDPLKRIHATEAEIKQYRLADGDLLLTEGGDRDKLGRGTLWQNQVQECIYQNHIFRVRLHDRRLSPLFLNWLVGSERGKRYFLHQAKQTTGIATINKRQLSRFPLLVPPLDLQRRFAAIVESVEQQKTRMGAHLAELDVLFTSLQSCAFTGQL